MKKTGTLIKSLTMAIALMLMPVFSQVAMAADYNINSGNVTINASGTHTITGTGAQTANRIVVQTGLTVNITMTNVHIVNTTNCAFEIQGNSVVNLTIEGTNILTSGNNGNFGHAGIEVPTGATLTISGSGPNPELTARGGAGSGNNDGGGAGIGSRGSSGTDADDSGTITINSGKITAIGGAGGGNNGGGGAGIGGGGGGQNGKGGGTSGSIAINGGVVTATGGAGGGQSGSAAGIGGGGGAGGGFGGNCGAITVGAAAQVTANGGTGGLRRGAGIGGGASGSGTNGNITGTVNIDPNANITATPNIGSGGTTGTHIAVFSITGVPATATVGTPLTLTGTVLPNNATNQTITWSLNDAGTTGATVTGNTFNATAAGTAVVTATVVNGETASTNYTQNFTITVSAGNTPPTATSITVQNSPAPRVGTALTGTYTYTAGTGTGAGTENGSTFKWYRSTANTWAGASPELITSATALSYTPTGADIGKYIYFEITPSNGTLTGTAVQSMASGVVGLEISLNIITNGTTGTATIGGGSGPAVVTNTTAPVLAATLGNAASVAWTVSSGGGTFTNAAIASPGYTLPTFNTSLTGPVTITATFTALSPLAQVAGVALSATGQATWTNLSDETGLLHYSIQLNKDGSISGSAKTSSAGTGAAGVSFLSEMRTAGVGSYTVTVTAIGNGTTRSSGPASAPSSPQQVQKLAAPTSPAWSGTNATWTASSDNLNVSHYSVTVTGGGTGGNTANNSVSTFAVTSPASGATFTVQAIAATTGLWLDSDPTTSSAGYVAPTVGLNPASVTLTNATAQSVTATGTATGTIAVSTLSPPNTNITVTPTASGVDVAFTGTMPDAGSPGAIISGPYTITVTRQGANETLTINVNIPAFTSTSAPSFTNQPANSSIVVGSNATFTVVASGTPAPAYQWQQLMNITGDVWTDIIDGGIYSGATTATLTLTTPPITHDGYKYRCVASNGINPDATSSEVFLYVNAATVFVTGVTLSESSKTLVTGGNFTLTATIVPSHATNQTVTWSSNAPGVATVVNGLVTAVAPGNATITVTTADGGFTAICAVTVNAAVYSISLNPATNKDFGTAQVGYGAITPYQVIINNTGNQPTGQLFIDLVGGNNTDFTRSGTGSITDIPVGGSESLNVYPNPGLGVGTYTTTVTVSGGNVTSASFVVSFTVTAATTTSNPNLPVAPRITGPTWMTLQTGYAATSTGVYTITGTSPVTVEKASGNSLITWNNTTRTIDIAAGLPAGEYPVVLRATNATGSPFNFTFTLTVAERVYYLDIPATFVGGKVVANTSNQYLAAAGQTVTLTITPDTGYELASIHVYQRGTSTLVPLTDPTQTRTAGAVQTRTFRMPANHIAVEAAFVRIGVSVEDVKDNKDFKAYVQDGVLYVSGVSAMSQSSLRVYNTLGTLIYQTITPDGKAEIPLPGRGIYIVTDGTAVVKVSN